MIQQVSLAVEGYRLNTSGKQPGNTDLNPILSSHAFKHLARCPVSNRGKHQN